MGYPYNLLVPAAVLYMNPGITRGQFVGLLDRTHSSKFHEYKDTDGWSIWTDKTQDPAHHEGMRGLAGILNLEYTWAYRISQMPATDEYGLLVHQPSMRRASADKSHAFEVLVHERNEVGEPKTADAMSWERLEVGSAWIDPQLMDDHGIVQEIKRETCYGDEKDPDDSEGSPKFRYEMVIRPVEQVTRLETFATEEEMTAKWPQFHTDSMYDWNQEKGRLAYALLGKNSFAWLQRGGRYFLDPDTFDRIPASFRCSGSLGYTDLVLTAEAVRHQAWKVVSYKGLNHFPKFLEAFPEVIPTYARAVWDAHTSLDAKRRGLTVNEFLRFRLGL